MEIRVLKYFLAVSREQNISNAAEYLHITQPTLSRQLKDLEDEIGKTLFIRGNRKITLTEDGILFKKRAEEIIDLVKKTETEFANTPDTISGEIFIGGGETLGMQFIANILNELHEDYPNIRYNIFSGNGNDVCEKLDNGLLDFGILIEPVDVDKYNYIKLPYYDTWGVLMKKDSPLTNLDIIKPKDIINLPLICSRQSLIKNRLSNWIGTDYENLDIVATYNLIFNAALMVKEGLGYALCVDNLIDTTANHDLCFRPVMNSEHSNLILVWKKYQVFSKPSEKFLEYVNKKITNSSEKNN